jgi:hypothetical protein
LRRSSRAAITGTAIQSSQASVVTKKTGIESAKPSMGP